MEMKAALRRSDGVCAFRWRVCATAEARGWPRVSYRPPVFSVHDQSSGRTIAVRMSGLIGGDSNGQPPMVVINSGRESWERFLQRALYHDLMDVSLALLDETPADTGTAVTAPMPAEPFLNSRSARP